jgi:NTE family protein
VSKKKFPTVGLALGSGAAKGFAHLGVLKELEENNIPIDYIAGTSIGAIIGAHYATFKDIKRLEELIFSFNRKRGFQLFDPTLTGGFVKGIKFERFIEEMLEGAKFDTLQIPFAAVATDFKTGRAIAFQEGDLTKAIRASSSVPAFFQPLQYKNHLLADGGLSNPVPVDIVRAMGADIVIAVNLDTVNVSEEKHMMLTKIPFHSINLLRHNLAIHSSKTADVIISPSGAYQVGLLGWDYLFSNEKARVILEAGEQATKKALPEIEKALRKKQTKTENFFTKFIDFFRN